MASNTGSIILPRTVHLWDNREDHAILKALYIDPQKNWGRPNVTMVRQDGSIFFEMNELGLKGGPRDAARRLIVAWGDSVVFGVGRGWPALLDERWPCYQVLNGGIEGDGPGSVFRRAIEFNRGHDVAFNLILPGWHDPASDFRADLRAALGDIPRPVLMTIPTSLNDRIAGRDLSDYFRSSPPMEFFFFGPDAYSVSRQQELLDRVTGRNRIIRRVAAEKNLELVDLHQTLDSTSRDDFRTEFFDVAHPRPDAYGKIADAVAAIVGPLLETS